MSIRILLADDHAIFRDALRTLIEIHTGMEVVGEAGAGRKAINLTRNLCPDIVIMDVSMPNMSGVDATKEVISAAPGVKVIGLSVHTDVKFASDILEAGASGYLIKESAFEDLIEAIRAVAENGRYLSSRVSNVIAGNLRNETPFRGVKRTPSIH